MSQLKLDRAFVQMVDIAMMALHARWHEDPDMTLSREILHQVIILTQDLCHDYQILARVVLSDDDKITALKAELKALRASHNALIEQYAKQSSYTVLAEAMQTSKSPAMPPTPGMQSNTSEDGNEHY